jgi:CDP-diacylglycerol--glycerol-3-phosphate 3-phosphatidyltransferase
MPWPLFVTLGLAFVSMGVYGLRGAKKDQDAQQKGSRFLVGLGDFFLHWFLWVLRPVERSLLRVGATPDFLNVLGLLLGMASGLLVALGRLEAGGWAMVGSGVADILDGRIARALKSVSPYGSFIDSTLDRFAEFFILLGFVYFLRDNGVGVLSAAAALGGSLLVSYARARGETLGVKERGGLMQRAERVVVLCLACLADGAVTARFGWTPGAVVTGALVVVAVTSVLTAVYRAFRISRELLRS